MADEKLYKVIASSQSTGDKLQDCRIIEELEVFDTDFTQVYGPDSLEACRAWARDRCANPVD